MPETRTLLTQWVSLFDTWLHRSALNAELRRRAMGQLDEHTLKDIGVKRSQVMLAETKLPGDCRS